MPPLVWWAVAAVAVWYAVRTMRAMDLWHDAPHVRARPPGRWARLAFDFQPERLLVNRSEQEAFAILHALCGGLRICPKVRLEDVARAVGPDRQQLRGGTRSRHLDFLLVDDAWRPVGAVEVDGGSHDRPDRSERDQFVDAVLDRAGIPVIRLRVGRGDWARELRGWGPLAAPLEETSVAQRRAPGAAAGSGRRR